jgi:hypothetical protein
MTSDGKRGGAPSYIYSIIYRDTQLNFGWIIRIVKYRLSTVSANMADDTEETLWVVLSFAKTPAD